MKWCAKIAAYVEVHRLPDLSSSSLCKVRHQVGFCASRDSSVHMAEYVCVYQIAITPESDRLQRYLPAGVLSHSSILP
jgi:hypothetical protein